MILVGFLLVSSFVSALPAEFNVQQYSAESENATLYILPSIVSSAPDIVILDDTALTLHRSNSASKTLSHTIPNNTLFFDLIDTDKNGVPELFVLTPDEIRHYPASNNQTTVQLFPITPSLPWSVKQPFLHPLIFPYNDTHLVAIPDRENFILKNLDGKKISSLPKLISDTHSLFSIPIEPNQLAPQGAFEFRIDSLLSTLVSVPQELRSKTPKRSFTTVTPRQLRDSEQLEFNQWPSFPLEPDSDTPTKVVYASYPPEHINTVIRIKRKLPRNTPTTAEPYRYSSKRIYPGMIGISEAGLPDFNNDGFNDLLLWKIPMPGQSVSSLINSVQAQTWPLEISIHLYNQSKGIYEARPTARIKLTVALQYILTRQNQSPLHNLSFEDLNGDGNSDIVFSPRPNQISAWLFDDSLNNTPDYTSEFSDEVTLITIHRTNTRNHINSVLLRGKRSIYRVSLSENFSR
jgi:hypothetical protein